MDLIIGRGEYVSIVGPSGSGKSTLLSCLGCLETPTSGRYLLDGEDVVGLSDDGLAHLRNRRIGFVFQSYNLLNGLTALENVALPLFYAGRPSSFRRRAAKEALERVGLSDRVNHFPDQLSGGQRQRVAIARAIVTNPAMILADEPTGALDTETAAEVVTTFESLHRDGSTIVLVTHDPKLAKRTQRRIEIVDGLIASDDDASLPRSSRGVPHRASG